MSKHTYTTTVSYESTTLESVRFDAPVPESVITDAVCRLVDDGKIVDSVRVFESPCDGKRYRVRHGFEVVDGVMTVSIDAERIQPTGRRVAIALKEPGDIWFRREVNDAACDSIRALIEVEHLVSDLMAEDA